VPADRSRADRKRLGAWYTPLPLVDTIVDAVVTQAFVDEVGDRPVDVLDPACGDGRFLAAVGRRVADLGGRARLVGAELDPGAAAAAGAAPGVEIVVGDALGHDWGGRTFDLVVGNPPFVSQLAAATTRGGSSSRGGGPYADVAAEFLALAADLVESDGGRVAFVLPQSLLSSRDAGEIRRRIDERATMFWSWWTRARVFEADVHVCAVGFEFRPGRRPSVGSPWGRVVTDALGIPPLPTVRASGTLADRVRLNANFRDEYYGMAPAVGDHESGPPLITSGLIDPGSSRWGQRSTRMARRSFDRPRVAVDRLDESMGVWAAKRLVPKVLLANQTRILEAVCDPVGRWLPGVPVVAAYPLAVHWDDRTTAVTAADRAVASTTAWEAAAVLTSPVASVWAWHRQAGTGLSAETIRVSPRVLGDLPWPAGDLGPAVAALRAGDVGGCGAAVDRAFGLGPQRVSTIESWWGAELERIERRRR